jgi:PKD repeat protein
MALRIGWSGRYYFYEVGYVRMDFIAEALYYAADNGAKIASCSWGSSNSGGLSSAISYFLGSGGIIFKAAGNDGSQTADYMCGLNNSNIVSVAATDSNDCKADFSTYGTWVDISAPGTGILSTYHDHGDPQSDYVAALDGTSMATPLSAGVAALIWSQNQGWSRSQVLTQLFESADDIDNLSCNSSYAGKLGAGRINAYNAVNTGTPPPVADFSGSPTSGCAPLTVNFTDQSTGDITSWDWDFGDGGSSTAQNPSYQYNSGGTYTVSLTVTGPGGSDTETKTNYITVNVGQTAGFVGSPTSGTEPLTVNFTDQSTGAASWDWDFGDGGSSTAQNPSHEYTSAGTYTVSLTVTNACGSDNETKTDYIAVDPCLAPVADFEGSPLSGEAPLTVSFTDLSTNGPSSWDWDFGDGGTSTSQNPSHEYTAAGTYTVSLTATNSCGSDTETKTDYITVTCTAPVADFIGDPTSGEVPLTVSFTDQSTGATSWDWDFGDGGTSTSQNPSHEYTSAGTYTVSLTATNSCGSDTETKTDYITVTCTAPVADFIGDPTSGEAPLTVGFTDQSTGATSWDWDFGDGGTSTAQNPTHEYTAAGTYTVSLTATNSCGSDTETKTDYITVTCTAPAADFVGSPTSGDAPLTVSFTDQSTGATSWDWDFGDGGTSTAQNPSHQYTAAGTYTVSLTATNSCGSDTETKTDYITVTEPAQYYMHVGDMQVTKDSWWILRRGHAYVKIVDAGGSPVANATVSGHWTAGASDSDQLTTGSDGWGECVSNWRWGDATFTFCVDDVTKSGWTYDPAANVMTCASSDGTVSAVMSKVAIDFDQIENVDGRQLVFNVPNPFNPTTEINFFVPEAGNVRVEVFNLLGQKISTLLDRECDAGLNSVTWDSRNSSGTKVASGIYFFRVTYENEISITKKMLLMK